MRDESPDRAALIRAGRAAFRPDPSDRERVLQSLTGALGPGALIDGARPAKLTKSVAPAASPVPAWVLGGLGALAIGGVVVLAAHPWARTPSQAAVSVAPSLPSAEPTPSSPIPPPANADDRAAEPRHAEGPSGAPKPVARSSAASTVSDSLPEEVRMLSRAEEQLNSGHADEALRTLAEHERRFPGGALAEERMAARVQALCALGRLAAARAELARFAQAYPRSPHVDRARRFCVVEAR
jgi:hypothetical protein